MTPKLPIYARGDSIGIAVYPSGISLDEVDIEMLLYTTGNGVKLYASTIGQGLAISKGLERVIVNIPPVETRKFDAGIATLETTYTVKVSGYKKILTDRVFVLTDTKITDYYG